MHVAPRTSAHDAPTPVAALIKTLREERGWSRSELARRCRTTYRQIHKWETEGKEPSAKNLGQLAEAFMLDVSVFVAALRGQDPKTTEWTRFEAALAQRGERVDPDGVEAARLMGSVLGTPTSDDYLDAYDLHQRRRRKR